MILREPCLPPGWYPREKNDISEFLEPFEKGRISRSGGGDAVIASAAAAPHAGWYYSGIPAAMAVSSLDAEAETVAVIGGHLPAGAPILMAAEDGVKTPLGTMEIDAELREKFGKQVSSRPDRYADNTVEVLLPMVHYFFPMARLLWLRFPAELSSFEAGKILAETGRSLRRHLAVLASTDLTHYGANYGFSPKGRGKPALEWVKNVNDAAFINAVLEAAASGDPSQVLERAEEDSSACSAGAVLGALGFTAFPGNTSGKIQGRLLDYRTSADVSVEDNVPDSFVGYAAISFTTA
jgi:AmmeMemoRadiSam system protein B